MTNFERIKEFTIDEMAEFIAQIQCNEINDSDYYPPEFNNVTTIAKYQKQWLEQED